nr:hypothetical protein [Pseudomonas sp. TH10]
MPVPQRLNAGPVASQKHRPSLVDDQPVAAVAFFVVDPHMGHTTTGRDPPVDGPGVIARHVFAQFFEIQTSAPHARAVLSGQLALARHALRQPRKLAKPMLQRHQLGQAGVHTG